MVANITFLSFDSKGESWESMEAQYIAHVVIVQCGLCSAEKWVDELNIY